MKLSIFSVCVILLCLNSCKPTGQDEENQAPDQGHLGQLDHGFNLNPEVQEKFDEGLLLLHNFEYDDALTAFQEARAIDSTEVLTHWGEAMCYYKALWRLQNTDKGKEIVSRLGDTKEKRLARIESPLERDMWEIVEIMYGQGDFDTRNKQIKEHLATLHEKYPDNQEIASFYALSLIWATEEYGNGSDDLRLAASIADEVIKKNPSHPGALHYKIHALDGPVSAKDALDAADAYDKVAPDAAHALHMPSHIYLALGQWEGVVHSNQRSFAASVKRMEEKELKDGARGYHSLAWLHYGLLQQGRYTEAEKIVKDMLGYVPKDPTKGARGYLLGMQSRQLDVNGPGNIEDQLDLDVDVDDIGITAKSVRSYLRAQVAFNNEDIRSLNDEITWLTSKIYLDSLNINESGIAMCAAGISRYAPTENSIKMAQVVLTQMEGFKAILENNEPLYEAKMKRAVLLEEQTNYPTGPPNIIKPSFEHYGEWLMKKGRYAEANQQFDQSLLRMPNRTPSLKGKWQALKALQKTDEAQKMESKLRDIYAHADPEIKEFLSI